jgi:hypothetical protein
VESRNVTFKGQKLFVCQFESKEKRQAHLEESRDRRRLDYHKSLFKSDPLLQGKLMNGNDLQKQAASGVTLASIIELLLLLKQIPAQPEF